MNFFNRPTLLTVVCAVVLHLSPLNPALAAISIETVPVGNPGNANDSTSDTGSVNYMYRIGKYEVTVGQYTAFLNSVAATDTYSLYNPLMATNLNVAGIERAGSSGSYSYAVIGSPDKPVTYVSWADAARFTNWLQNGQPIGIQNSSTTETGAYLLNGANTDTALRFISRTSNANWFIPSENEWHKAAFHQPATQGGDADNYWYFPTRTNITPNSDQPPGNLSIQTNAANFFRDDGIVNDYNDGYATSGSTTLSSGQNYLTDVGAYSQSSSYYGTFDQGGNVYEWTDDVFTGFSFSFRRTLGGSWETDSSNLNAALKNGGGPLGESESLGFRVGIIPEPSTTLLICVSVTVLLRQAFRRKNLVT